MQRRTERLMLGGLGLAVAALAVGPRTPLIGQTSVPPIAAAATGGAFNPQNPQGDEDEAPRVTVVRPTMTAAAARTWLKMQEPVAMPFATNTPIGEVVAHVRKSTADPASFPRGIPIYVDPGALADADKTLDSPVTIDLEGIPLATTLKLALAQLDLAYHVNDDGLVCVVSQDDAEQGDDMARILGELEALRNEVRSLRPTLNGAAVHGGMSGGMSGGMGGKGGMM